jgi:hypothetical protein
MPALALFNEVHKLVMDHVKKIIATHFASFGHGHFQQRVMQVDDFACLQSLTLTCYRIVVSDQIKKCCERTAKMIEWLCLLEERPYSLNTHYFSDYKAKFFAYYKACREKHANVTLMNGINLYKTHGASYQPNVANVMSGLANLGLTGVQPGDIAKLLPADEFDISLTIMADVRAYFQGRSRYLYRSL